MRRLRRTLLVLAGLGIVVCANLSAPRVGRTETTRLSVKAAGLKTFLGRPDSRYNTKLAFLIDMRLPSGKNRFFVYDLDADTVRMAGLVAHGSGGRAFSLTPSFSNVNGSNCSALGRYKIGSPYAGRFGRAYFLHGLDTTNNQALTRHIVLHSYSCVPNEETYPYPICNSQGCPMVAPAFLQRLQPLIDGSKKPIMLWIFY